MSNALDKTKGFTLVEMSIVLVIIGLLVGGVLAGQDLIRAAEIRSTISQIEKYNTSMNTFRAKFNGIPGDISAANATMFGLLARAGSIGRGDNNGMIEGSNAGALTTQVFTQESGFFWDDLTRAGLIDGQFVSAADAASVGALSTAAAINAQFPEAKLGRGNDFHVGSIAGINYYLITGMSAVTATTGVITHVALLTPTELFNIDSKLDDGIPLSGIVQARGRATSTTTPFADLPTASTTAAVGICTTGTGLITDTYNRSLNAGGNTISCIGRVRFN